MSNISDLPPRNLSKQTLADRVDVRVFLKIETVARPIFLTELLQWIDQNAFRAYFTKIFLQTKNKRIVRGKVLRVRDSDFLFLIQPIIPN